MANVSFDAQSFMVDGRRTWLVSGAMHYPRIPRAQWSDRLRAAREAGLNCIETYVFWNIHERKPNHFDFSDNLDLRHFVELCAEHGLWVILRPGPYVCSEWDMGGLPSWLLNYKGTKKSGPMKLREGSMPFLEATARYLRAVMEQVSDLQVTTERPTPGPRPGLGTPAGQAGGGYRGQGNGPVILMQAENEWFCSNPEQEDAYLRQVVRHLQEHGCRVPIINCNNLWQRVEGTIDCWNASQELPAFMRQMATIQDRAPRLVTEYWSGWFDAWGGPHADSVDDEKHLARLCGLLGVGAQPNLYMFHGGTNFGFWGGRTVNGRFCYMTTSYDFDAPLLEGGGRAGKFDITKQVCTFASQFSNVFASLEATYQPVALTPGDSDHDASVLHQRGKSGDVAFVIKGEKSRRLEVALLLPDGRTMPVPLGSRRASWVVINVDLDGAAVLDYTNLCAWAFVDRQMLCLFGPESSTGLVSINDTAVQLTVPAGNEPLVESVDGITVVVMNEQQVDAAYLAPAGLMVGCQGLTPQGQPIPRRGWSVVTTVSPSGEVSTQASKAVSKPRAPQLSGWQYASVQDFVTGTSPSYTPVKELGSLGAMGQDVGYGWYRLPRSSAVTGRLVAPLGGDRLHLFAQGKRKATLGVGPGTHRDTASLSLPKSDLVVLADNLGRFNYGAHVGHDLKGLPHGLHTSKPLSPASPMIEQATAADPFTLRAYAPSFRRGETGPAHCITWKLKLAAGKPVLMQIDGLDARGVVTLNDSPHALYAAGDSANFLDVLIDPADEPGKTGVNYVTLTLDRILPDTAKALKTITFQQLGGVIHDDSAPVGFAGFEVPEDAAFDDTTQDDGLPCWWACDFQISSTRQPLWLEPHGMSKGQLYLNGINLGRYWVATDEGEAVPPQSLYYLPEGYLHTDQPNRLLLFDEHGKSPDACTLVYNLLGPHH